MLQDIGGKIIEPKTAEEDQAIYQAFGHRSGGLWLGIVKLTDFPQLIYYSDAGPTGYVNWAYPPDLSSRDSCLAYVIEDGWELVPCISSFKRGVICEFGIN